jgi:hypothetical protein
VLQIEGGGDTNEGQGFRLWKLRIGLPRFWMLPLFGLVWFGLVWNGDLILATNNFYLLQLAMTSTMANNNRVCS